MHNSTIRHQSIDTPNIAAVSEETAITSGSQLRYMGMLLDQKALRTETELMRDLNSQGGIDAALDKTRELYTEKFGNQLIWRYPFSDNMQGGGVIVPLQEGFLFLPYSTVTEEFGALYDLRHAHFLTLQAVQTMQTECKAYMNGLLAALDDIADCTRSYTIRRYSDQHGNLYFVRAGIGDVYKGFCRRVCPKKGCRQETGIRSLEYTTDRWKAQIDLDKYALKHHLRLLSEDAFDGAAGGDI